MDDPDAFTAQYHAEVRLMELVISNNLPLEAYDDIINFVKNMKSDPSELRPYKVVKKEMRARARLQRAASGASDARADAPPPP
mmetsp:Transcript_5526/g.19674  ORF Transcript_5526/g.19674 Transcript_5526/m.19674 type:complete len:83 (-) Transcript_5526:129-377(-)